MKELRENNGNMEGNLIDRERERQRIWEDNKIAAARCNSTYRKIERKNPRYLEKEFLDKVRVGRGIKALIKLRCRNTKKE